MTVQPQRLVWVGLGQAGLFSPVAGSAHQQKDGCELELRLRQKGQSLASAPKERWKKMS